MGSEARDVTEQRRLAKAQAQRERQLEKNQQDMSKAKN